MKILSKGKQEEILENGILLDMLLRKFKDDESYFEIIGLLDDILEQCLSTEQLDRMSEIFCELN